MKVNELRNDNWVSCIYNGLSKDVQVYDFDRKEIQHTDEGTKPLAIRRFDPIPLTEEWLLKFGFKKSKNRYELKCFSLGKYPKDGSIYLTHTSNNDMYTDILFVHQLQNLYFALTGSELTIKETA